MEPIELTRTQLLEFDGKEGRRAYVAVGGIIYDVTDFPPLVRGDP